ncbi:hybrid sensor histidine kinase/response regulator [Planktothrix mougeotii]|uniref:histidine kinase n=1 Tax=Planktothrix mougeotii LEGE 06226 TaxID=1828728 RepID=A0ABR9UCM1_9CYAN|nr:response regulator [Planktothrix mougeotii]MBE9143869.1 response regulator [Planktothrix mougeotii LEGE 06226]
METTPIILIIDDDPDNFDVIETLLANEGYELGYVSKPKQAFNLLESSQPDLILLDVMMPEMNGIEFCKLLKANPQWSHIPVIMVTALSGKEDLSQCLQAGADDFISKPVNGIELRARIRSMLRIKQQYDRIEMLMQLREDMVNMIVHDLRNPLAGILFSTEILKKPSLSPERQQKKIQQIEANCTQLQVMIDSLLLMAKLESGKMILNFKTIDLGEVCRLAIQDFELISSHKKITIVPDLPPLGINLSVDAVILRRVIDNLLSNAIKFSPSESQILLQAKYLENGGATVKVIDSGPGVGEKTRQTLFQKYEIGTIQEGVSQIGLGLAFCKIAIEAHGGSISLEDHHPKGSIFTIHIPG